MNHNNETKSRRITPWTGVANATPLQKLIVSCTERDYSHRHPTFGEINESEFVNSKILTTCRYCTSSLIVKDGFSSNGIRRYMCNTCHRRFTALTNTIFDSHKLPISEWIGFLLDIMDFGSYRFTSKVNRNSSTTTKYWIDKLFLVLKGIQDDIILGDKVWLDEAFFKVRAKDIKYHANGKEYSGLSRNQLCIGIACDKERSVFFFEGYGKPNQTRTLELFSPHIRHESTLIHDMDLSHNALVTNLNLCSKQYDARLLKGVPDSQNPLDRVNKLCYLLQAFLKSHTGFIREDIQGYLDLFYVIVNQPDNKYEKIEMILNRSLDFPILLRYRQ